jgi:hypothetical protein
VLSVADYSPLAEMFHYNMSASGQSLLAGISIFKNMRSVFAFFFFGKIGFRYSPNQ